MALETLYSIEQAAQKLGGISRFTIEQWLSLKKLQRTKVGRRTMISESELERFIRANNPSQVAEEKLQ